MSSPTPLPARLQALARRPEPYLFLAVLVVLGLSVATFKSVPPSGKPWGLDLQNLHAFHACSFKDAPYEAKGFQCGDWLRRPFVYPPLLYWSFVWTRGLTWETVRDAWTVLTGAILVASPILLTRGAGDRLARGAAILFGVVLGTQFPAVFAFERGNTDIPVVLFWSVGALLYLKGHRISAGLLIGAMAPYKLYPAVGCVVLVAGLAGMALRGDRARRVEALRFAGGLFLGAVIPTLFLAGMTSKYLRDVLPGFAAHLPGVSLHSHSVPATFRPPLYGPKLVSGALILLWSGAAFLRFDKNPREVLVGALAITTYVAGTSFDYNLVTAYPLLVVLALRAMKTAGKPALWAWASLGLGVLGVCADHAWFTGHPRGHVVVQVVWLLLTAGLLAWRAEPEPSLERVPARAS